MGVFAMLTVLFAVALAGQVFMIKAFDQRSRDKNRATYRLGFPADLDAVRVAAWVRSISGTLRGSRTRLFGVQTIAFEMWASDQGIVHRIKVPWQHADYVISQLRSLVPGIRVMPEEEYPREDWTRTVEVGLTNSSRQLRIFTASDMSTSLLAAVHPLHKGEKMLVQWVMTPAMPAHKPIYKLAKSDEVTVENILTGRLANRDEVNDRREKLEEPNLMAVLRVAAVATTDERADHLIHNVRAALSSSRAPSTRFVRRLVTSKSRQRRIESSASPVIFPMQLSAAEVTSLIAWPLGNPFIPGLPPVMSRHLPASEIIPRQGRIIGVSNMPGNERPIAVSYEDARKHMHVVGPTGCLHPDTPIFDPVAGSTMSVYERFKEGQPFHVFALDGEKLVIAAAEPPIEYRREYMYELYNDEHRIVVTGQHRVWDGRSYVEVQSLAACDALLPSISDNDLSKLLSDAQHLTQRRASFLDRYCLCCRRCGPLPRSAKDSYRASVPSQGDVRAQGSACSYTDGQARVQAHIHVCRCAALPSKNRSSHPSIPYHEMEHPQVANTSILTSSSPSLPDICPAHSLHDDIAIHTLQFVPESTYPSPDLLFKQYFKDTSFKVRPAKAETYYDFHVPRYENYLACGLIHHNTGKTVLLSNLMKQDIEQGYGVVLIENKGDLFNMALNYVPKERMQDVVVLDVNDTSRPVGFNLLNQGDPRVIVDELVGLFDQLYRGGGTGVWTREVLYFGLHTLIKHPELTFVDLAPLLVPMSTEETNWRDSIIRSVNDLEIRNFWQRFLNQPRAAQDRITQPVMDRIWQLNARPELRRIIGQSTSSFQMTDIVRDNKILLVNLAGIGRETASLTGSMLMNSLWHAVKTTRSDRPTFLYLDEFQDFMTLPIDPEDMLAKARGFGLGMILAHQHLSQLGNEMQQAVMANARTKVIFQTSADDARAMSREFGNAVNDADFMHLGRYEAISRIATGEGVSAPVTLATKEPARGYGKARQIREASRAQYGRLEDQVVEEIQRRRTTVKQQQNRKPPTIGGGWG